jgi:hypothetical protein
MALHRLTSSKQTSIAIIAVESDIPHLMSKIYQRQRVEKLF